MSRETLTFDVIIVGAGPAGLAAACRFGQLARDRGVELAVGLVEKGAEVGAHIVSGALLEPRALEELFPDWRERGAPLDQAVAHDELHWLLGERSSVRVPKPFVPRPLANHGNYVVSLGDVCRWLAREAEALGCQVLPGIAATHTLYEDGRVVGVGTGDMGVARDGSRKPGYQPGYDLRARYVVFAEGCRGHLGKELEARFDLRARSDPPHYGLGLKEIWQIAPERHRPGHVVHTVGWPLDGTEGGGFLYHGAGELVSLGLIVGLGYRNPYLDPFLEFQRWKHHPLIRAVLEGGQRIAYAARAVNKGGLSSLPKLVVPGGVLAGCDAGFLNDAKAKGSHTAIKTGMLAAEAIFAAVAAGDPGGRELDEYVEAVRSSWVWEELHRARNFHAGVARFGAFLGGALAFIEHNVLRGRSPITLHDRVPDHATLSLARDARPIAYPKPDGVVSFDRMSSVFVSNTAHEEDQPCHLLLEDARVPIDRNLPLFDEPAQRYCPAGVYEVVRPAGAQPQFRINAANCVHCKTCDIKDPAENIDWVPPEGGGGPNYVGT